MPTRTQTKEDALRARWHELKGSVKRRWSKLTDDDITMINGSQEELVSALRRRYGFAQAQAVLEIYSWMDEPNRRHELELEPPRGEYSSSY